MKPDTQQVLSVPKDLPADFTVSVQLGGTPAQLLLSRHTIRTKGFRVLRRHADGSCAEVVPPQEATYVGMVAGDPGSMVTASRVSHGLSARIVRGNGQVFRVRPLVDFDIAGPPHVHVVEELNGTAHSRTNDVRVPPPGKMLGNRALSEPATTVQAKQAAGATGTGPLVLDTGSPPWTFKAVVLAFELDWTFQQNRGFDTELCIADVQQYCADVDLCYARDALTRHMCGTIVFGAESDSLDLADFASRWDANHTDIVRDSACLVAEGWGNAGGLAYVSTMGGWSYCASYWVNGHALEHELGHNWGAPDWDDPWAGNSTMNGNGSPRWLGPSLHDDVLARRIWCADPTTGPYVPSVPPYAMADRPTADIGYTNLFDVLANDHDANDNTLTIVGFDTVSARGVSIVRSVGTGPGGRDQLAYVPSPVLPGGYEDTFWYTIQDNTGLQHTSRVAVQVGRLRATPSLVVEEFMDGLTGGVGFDGPWLVPEAQNVHYSPRPLAWTYPVNVPFVAAGGHAYKVYPDDNGTMTRALDTNRVNIDLAQDAEFYLSFVGRPNTLVYFSGGRVGLLDSVSSNEIMVGWAPGNWYIRQPCQISGALGTRTQSDYSVYGIDPDSPRFFVARIVTRAAGNDTVCLKVYRCTSDSVHVGPEYLSGEGNGLDQWTLITSGDGHCRFDRLKVFLTDGQAGANVDEIRVGRTWEDVTGLSTSKARCPFPADGARTVRPESSLTWTGAVATATHHLYLGTNFWTVWNATPASSEFRGNLTGTVFRHPPLTCPAIYYWRVDEVTAGSGTRGDVWRFHTRYRTPWTTTVLDQFTDGGNGVSMDGLGGGAGFGSNWAVEPGSLNVRHSTGQMLNTYPQNVPFTAQAGYAYKTNPDDIGCLLRNLDLSTVEIDLATDSEYYLSFAGRPNTMVYFSGGKVGLRDSLTWTDIMLGWTPGDWYVRQPYAISGVLGNCVQTDYTTYGMDTNSPRFFVGRIVARSTGSDELYLKVYRSDSDLVHAGPDRLSGAGNGSNQWTLVAAGKSDVVFNQLRLYLLSGQTGCNLDEVRIGRCWRDVTGVGDQAYNQQPVEGATGVLVTTHLSWSAGAGTISHNVYLGADYVVVANANTGSTEFKGNQSGTDFDPGVLSSNATYYWRIDEVRADGTSTGLVWSFNTECAVLHAIVTVAHPNGTVTPQNPLVPPGSNQAVTIVPDPYYHTTAVIVDEILLAATNNYTFTNVTNDHSLVALFAENTAALGTPEWWLARHGWTNSFSAAETNDADHDGLLTWEEWIAGTDPTNMLSVLSVTNLFPSASIFVLNWSSVPNRFYSVDRATNLVLPGFETVATNLPATPPVNVHTDQVPGIDKVFYRIKVEKP